LSQLLRSKSLFKLFMKCADYGNPGVILVEQELQKRFGKVQILLFVAVLRMLHLLLELPCGGMDGIETRILIRLRAH
jgi:hypothetical protein